MTDTSNPPRALDGVLVLDLSRILAGPTATQLLGDLGATILKIEPPEKGDDTRSWGPPYAKTADGKTDLSAYFMSANRNKYSIPADLKNPEELKLVQRLAAEADILVQNFKPGGLDKFGLDYETVASTNSRLVYCSISGFGQTGPNRDRPGYDLMAQGYGGIMSLTGAPEGPPMKVGVGIADVMCGMYASVGVLAALRHAEATGQGQHIDLSLVDSQMAWLINEGTNFLTSGNVPERRGNAHPNIVPYDVFACSDGHIIVAVGNDTQFQRFCTVLGRADLAVNPDFQTNPARIENRKRLTAHISEILAVRPKEAVLEMLQVAKVPSGPINNLAEALFCEQAEARGSVIEMSHDACPGDPLKLLGNPLKFSLTPVVYDRPPPRVGQDVAGLERLLEKTRSKRRKGKS